MASQPSILWIVTTQWRAQACGYAGDPNARTPSVDALAAQSVNYAQAVTPHPFGPFARAAMLTGVPSPENGVREYFDPLPVWSGASGWHGETGADRASGRARGEVGWTIAHTLNALGYTTAFFGKWHLSKRDPHAALVGEAHARTIVPPEARGGFAHWEGFESGFLLNDPWLHGTGLDEPQRFRGYQSDVVCERAARWLRAGAAGGEPGERESERGAARRPWFTVVSLEPPHPPYTAAAGSVAPRDATSLALPPNVPQGGEVEVKARAELAGYYAHIEATDRAIGELVAAVDAVERDRQRPAPIVVFTSVHGDMHGAHGRFRKGWPHEESVRVPLLVRPPTPGNSARGFANGAMVSLIDLPRWTQLWAEGGSVMDSGSGVGEAPQRISMPSAVPLPHQCDRAWSAVRTPTRKLVLNPDGSPWLLFDLDEDPWEQRNLVREPGWRGEIDRLLRLIVAPSSG